MALIPDSKVADQAVKFMQFIAGPDGQKMYTKESTHLPTLNALLADSSLYDAQHKLFLDLLPTAKSRPPLAVGAAYWDALTSARARSSSTPRRPRPPSRRSRTPSNRSSTHSRLLGF